MAGSWQDVAGSGKDMQGCGGEWQGVGDILQIGFAAAAAAERRRRHSGRGTYRGFENADQNPWDVIRFCLKMMIRIFKECIR